MSSGLALHVWWSGPLRDCDVEQVSAADWDACAMGDGEMNPFLLHAFLLAMETSGSAVRLALSLTFDCLCTASDRWTGAALLCTTSRARG